MVVIEVVTLEVKDVVADVVGVVVCDEVNDVVIDDVAVLVTLVVSVDVGVVSEQFSKVVSPGSAASIASFNRLAACSQSVSVAAEIKVILLHIKVMVSALPKYSLTACSKYDARHIGAAETYSAWNARC